MLKNILSKVLQKLKVKKLLFDLNQIGKDVEIGSNCVIKGSAINSNVKVGENCRIMYSDIQGEVTIGSNTSIWGPNVSLRSALNPITIGNFCSIAKNVSIQEYNHNSKSFTTYFYKQNILKSGSHRDEVVSKGPIYIENDVWVGANSVILGGSHISTGAIVAAGSIVIGYVPPYAIVAGSPAKVIKYRFNSKVIETLLATKWWMWDIDEIKKKISVLESIVEEVK